MQEDRQIVVLDFDDLDISTLEIELLIKLREHIPHFKVSMFTVPIHKWLMEDEKRFEQLMLWMEALKDMDWMEICLHGFMHDKTEMMVNYDRAKATIKSAERAFTSFKVQRPMRFFGKRWIRYEPNLPYKKIFKAPGWQMSREAYEAARDLGYVVATDRNNPDPEIEGLKTYRFNWSIEEPYPHEYKVVKGHGHVVGMANSLTLNYDKLLRELPQEAEYMTISEYLALEKK